MRVPSVAELRPVVHPPGLLDRRSGEHWAGRLYMRRLSLHADRLFLAVGATPNALTGLMIFTGVAAGGLLMVPGLAGALASALFVQLYLLLDCSDGEIARWTRRTSVTGVYLDRVGHYLAEAALLAGAGVRAGAGDIGSGWVSVGLFAALGAILVKAQTDLVDVARARAGLAAVSEAAAVPRSAGVARARRLASALKLHRIVGGVEASLLLLAAAVLDAVLPPDALAGGGVPATRALVAAFAGVAGAQTVLHLSSILASNRLRA